ncbi:MAG TPA: proton-conducting transporter membrane subunit [Woeseiaceae bacterium]|nr:proton-conducting transporter membrane subunit [Woeseiaceae bacterium]
MGGLLIVAVCWPLLTALALLPPALRPLARRLAPWAALPALLVSAATVTDTGAGWLMFGGGFGIDGTAAVLLPVTSALWLASGLFARHHLPAGTRRDLFFGWFLPAMAGNLLLLTALDAVIFYLCYTLMSVTAYGLIVHSGEDRARHAGRYYFAMAVVGEVCIVNALMLLAGQGPTDFAALGSALAADGGNVAMALLVIGFGIKAGVFGLHFWLPLAHPVAPAPASAVLSGAMIKAGLVGWLRLFPLGESALPEWGALLAVLGILTTVYGVAAGLPQTRPKTVLAYSSISQIGLMTVTIALGLIAPAAWPLLHAAVLLFIVHHCFTKGTLFLGAGLLQAPMRPALARLVTAVFAVCSLALAAGMYTGGLLAKLALKEAAAGIDEDWYPLLAPALGASSVLTGLLMLRFLILARPAVDRRAPPLSPGMLLPWLALFGASVAAPWWLAEPVLRTTALAPAALWDASWPVVLAAAIAASALWSRRAGLGPRLPAIPAGDLGMALERGLLRLGRRSARLAVERALALRERGVAAAGAVAAVIPRWSARVAVAEEHATAWSVTGTLAVLLAVAAAWLMI